MSVTYCVECGEIVITGNKHICGNITVKKENVLKAFESLGNTIDHTTLRLTLKYLFPEAFDERSERKEEKKDNSWQNTDVVDLILNDVDDNNIQSRDFYKDLLKEKKESELEKILEDFRADIINQIESEMRMFVHSKIRIDTQFKQQIIDLTKKKVGDSQHWNELLIALEEM